VSFRSELQPDLAEIRKILGPGEDGLDMRPTSVTILTTVWSGGIRGSGTPSSTPLRLPPETAVRQLSQKEIAESGGRYEAGDVIISLINPAYQGPDGAGGFTEAQLGGATASMGSEVTYQLAQQSGATGIVGTYTLLEFHRDPNFHFTLIVRRSVMP
jgi:hypothetical protein